MSNQRALVAFGVLGLVVLLAVGQSKPPRQTGEIRQQKSDWGNQTVSRMQNFPKLGPGAAGFNGGLTIERFSFPLEGETVQGIFCLQSRARPNAAGQLPNGVLDIGKLPGCPPGNEAIWGVGSQEPSEGFWASRRTLQWQSQPHRDWMGNRAGDSLGLARVKLAPLVLLPVEFQTASVDSMGPTDDRGLLLPLVPIDSIELQFILPRTAGEGPWERVGYQVGPERLPESLPQSVSLSWNALATSPCLQQPDSLLMDVPVLIPNSPWLMPMMWPIPTRIVSVEDGLPLGPVDSF